MIGLFLLNYLLPQTLLAAEYVVDKPSRISGPGGPGFTDALFFYMPIIMTIIVLLLIIYVIVKSLRNHSRMKDFRLNYKRATNQRAQNIKRDYAQQLEDTAERQRQMLELERQRIDNLLTASSQIIPKLEGLIKRYELLAASQIAARDKGNKKNDNLAYLPPKTRGKKSSGANDSVLDSLDMPIRQKKAINHGGAGDSQLAYKKIYELNDMGWALDDIAKTVGINKNTVNLILSMRKRKES